MNDIAIRTESLCFQFGAIHAVDNLTLQVPRGIVFGFLGPNGAGKTTTIRLLLGLLKPARGHAQVLGYDTRKQPGEIRQRAGALMEHHGLYERLSALDNLDFWGRIYHMPTSDRHARIQDLLTHFQLWDRRHERVGSWSRGMKQKVAVARTLLHHPQAIFLDEPTSGLDPVAAAALREDIASLAEKEGVSVFLNTHNLPEAEKLCSQVGVIRQGKLLAVGNLEEMRTGNGAPQLDIFGNGFTPEILAHLQEQPQVRAVSVQNNHLQIDLEKTGGQAAPLVSLLVHAGVQVEEVHKKKASLEDVFLKMMEEEAHDA